MIQPLSQSDQRAWEQLAHSLGCRFDGLQDFLGEQVLAFTFVCGGLIQGATFYVDGMANQSAVSDACRRKWNQFYPNDHLNFSGTSKADTSAFRDENPASGQRVLTVSSVETAGGKTLRGPSQAC